MVLALLPVFPCCLTPLFEQQRTACHRCDAGVGEEVVILSEILSLPGEDLPSLDCSGPQRVTHINGERVHSLAHLAERFVALTTEPLDAAEVSSSSSCALPSI